MQHCLASSLCLWLYGIIMESFDAITHHTYFYDHTQCDSAPRTDDGEQEIGLEYMTLSAPKRSRRINPIPRFDPT